MVLLKHKEKEKITMTLNEQNEKLASTIVRATVTDWHGNVLFESNDYYKALDVYDYYNDGVYDNVFINSYDKQGNNHGIFY